MAVIHQTTLTPGKLELIAAWLPRQPWYAAAGAEPQLDRAGGFRLDDPDGAVGLEFMVVTDSSGETPVAYHVPLTYRGAPFDLQAAALIGTAEHGVLGTRWIYDGAYDPVLAGQLLALILGTAQAQAQRVSDTPDPMVASQYAGPPLTASLAALAVADTADGTDLRLTLDRPNDQEGTGVTVRILRRLSPAHADDTHNPGWVVAGWQLPDGTGHRGEFALLLP